MAQKQSQSLIFATQQLRPTLFMLIFRDLKQMVHRFLTAIVDRTLTACNRSAAQISQSLAGSGQSVSCTC